MNVFTAKKQLPSISKLFRERTRHFITWLHNLRVIDINTEEQYNKTVSFIKNAILIQPILFGRPVFTGRTELQQASLFGSITPWLQDLFIRQISFPFRGSRELFYYASVDDSLDSEADILMPAEQSLQFRLDAVYYNRSRALRAARDILRPTLKMIAKNNALAAAWSARVEKRIENKLKKYQRESLNLYDPNSLLLLLGDG